VFALLKLLQSLAKTLHSDGTPNQIAMGVALGAALGLTPLVNVHSLVILVLLMILNVSFGAGMLGWMLFAPIGFLLDPLFDLIGGSLLTGVPAFEPLWTRLDSMPLVPFTNFNNTIVLGSLVVWLLLFVPIYLLARVAVVRYRLSIGERVRQWRIYRAVTASRAYNVYRWFNG
jgi:uncharacterized protein (TIGR03546 family)